MYQLHPYFNNKSRYTHVITRTIRNRFTYIYLDKEVDNIPNKSSQGALQHTFLTIFNK